MNTDKLIQDLQEQLNKLKSKVSEVEGLVNKNSFSSSQTFNKDCSFLTRLQVPHYSSAPTVSQVGDLIEIGGKLYICTTANTIFTLVGSQT